MTGRLPSKQATSEVNARLLAKFEVNARLLGFFGSHPLQ